MSLCVCRESDMLSELSVRVSRKWTVRQRAEICIMALHEWRHGLLIERVPGAVRRSPAAASESPPLIESVRVLLAFRSSATYL